MITIKRTYYVIMAAVTVAALAGCSASHATTRPRKLTTVVVDVVPAVEEVGVFIADQKGYFRQQGLNVKIKMVAGGEAGIPDLQSGAAQFVGGNYVSFVLAQIAGKANGKPASFRIVAPAAAMQPGSDALYVLPGSGFKSVADLARAHATVGLNTPRDVGQVLLGSLLQDNGFALSSIRQVTPAGGFPALVTMLKNGQVDAAWFPQPFGTMVEQEYGATELADFDQGAVQSLPFVGYIGMSSWVASHPATVGAFVRAVTEGQQVADTSRAAAEAAMERYTGLKPVVAATMPFTSYPLGLADATLQRVANAMFEFGLTPSLKQPYRIAGMISP